MLQYNCIFDALTASNVQIYYSINGYCYIK